MFPPKIDCSVSGNVKNNKNDNLENVKIELDISVDGKNQKLKAETDDQGNYSLDFEGYQGSDYSGKIFATKSKYKSKDLDVVAKLNPGNNYKTNQNFVLSYIP